LLAGPARSISGACFARRRLELRASAAREQGDDISNDNAGFKKYNNDPETRF
jgi:hypothetical protein